MPPDRKLPPLPLGRHGSLRPAHAGQVPPFESPASGSVRVRMEALEGRPLRWMFLFWVGTMGTLVALLKL